MGVEDELYTRLSGYAGLTALLGSGNDFKLYPVPAPQDTARPFVTYQLISERDVHAMGSNRSDKTARFQFDCFGESYESAKTLSEQLQSALTRYHSSTIQDIFRDTSLDGWEDRTELYRRTVDFLVHYLE